MDAERSALLIRCSREEAQKIREAARRERRTVSGYVLQLVMNHVVMNRVAQQENRRLVETRVRASTPSRAVPPNTRRRL
jgi:hypothetical protein